LGLASHLSRKPRHGDGELPRIDGTRYFYRDGSELEEELEMFEELMYR
jgi:hypothetical protein